MEGGAALLKRFGPVMLIFSGAAAGVLRWYLTGISTEVWILTIAQALHAFTFGAAHLGGMTFISRVAPKELLTTAQTLYSALAMGAAMALLTPLPAGSIRCWGLRYFLCDDGFGGVQRDPRARAAVALEREADFRLNSISLPLYDSGFVPNSMTN